MCWREFDLSRLGDWQVDLFKEVVLDVSSLDVVKSQGHLLTMSNGEWLSLCSLEGADSVQSVVLQVFAAGNRVASSQGQVSRHSRVGGLF